MKRLTEIFKSLLPYLAITITVLYYFKEVIFNGQIFIHTGVVLSDLFLFNYPIKNLLYQSLLSGNGIPFWTDLIGNGYPIFAEGQIGALNPLNLLAFSLPLPFYLSFNLMTILQFILGGFFTFKFLTSSVKVSKISALFGSLVFIFSGYMIANLHHLNVLQVLFLFPLNLLLSDKLLTTKIEKNNAKRIITIFLLLSFLFAYQITAGHIESTYQNFLFLFIFILIRIFTQKDTQIKLINKAFIFIAALTTALLFSAPQLLSTFELVKNSVRQQGVQFEYSTSQAWPIQTLEIFINPHKYPLYIDGMQYQVIPDVYTHLNWLYLYMGYLPLILVLFALISFFIKNKSLESNTKKWILTFTILISIVYLYAVGSTTQLFSILWEVIPGLKLFRYQIKSLYVIQFSLVILASIGFNLLQQKLLNLKKRNYLFNSLFCFLILITFIDLLINNKWIQPTVNANQWLEQPQIVKSLKQNACPNNDKSCNLFYQSRVYSRGSDGMDIKRIFDQTLQQDLKNNLYPDFNILYDIPLNYQYTGLPLKETDLLNSYDTAINPETDQMIIDPKTKRILNIQSVEYLITHNKIENSSLELIDTVKLNSPYAQRLPLPQSNELKFFNNDEIYLYKNPDFISRFRLIPQSAAISNNTQTASELNNYTQINDIYQTKIQDSDNSWLASLTSENFDPRKNILLDSKWKGFDSSLKNQNDESTATASSYQITSYSPQKYTVEVHTNTPSFFVISDTFYPGWQAQIDGKATEILQANYTQRAIQIPPGDHKLTLSFEPTYWKLGLYLTLTASLISVLALIYVSYLSFIDHKAQIAKK